MWALITHGRSEVYPEDIQELAKYVLGHRIWLAPQATGQGIRAETIIDDIVTRVPIP